MMRTYLGRKRMKIFVKTMNTSISTTIPFATAGAWRGGSSCANSWTHFEIEVACHTAKIKYGNKATVTGLVNNHINANTTKLIQTLVLLAALTEISRTFTGSRPLRLLGKLDSQRRAYYLGIIDHHDYSMRDGAPRWMRIDKIEHLMVGKVWNRVTLSISWKYVPSTI